MTLNRRRLAEWVGRRTLQPPVARAFRLFHEGRHGLNQVCDVPLEGGAEDWPDHVARVVHEEARTHADAYPGRQQYIVRAFVDDKAVGEFPFGMVAETDGPAASLAMPTPDYQAAMTGQIPLQDFSHPHAQVMGQQMRHNEALVRYIVDLTMSGRERDGATMKRQQDHIDHLESDRIKVIEMSEEMLSRKQERAIVQDKWDSEKARKDKLMKMLVNYVLPEAAKRIGVKTGAVDAGHKPVIEAPDGNGNGGGNGDASAKLAEIKQLFMKLSPETQSQIVGELPEEDENRLLTIFEGKDE